ncbi:unnamed protein product [Cuscuta epithymum]|uniref:Uncharacterized protein n=1 Tax=Cuscuta epithymum TaxID=186058 RepID=A0AAV0FKD6_9ASTE|nr:unnamed protein product [Cuscuta epithymum]
MYLLWDKNLLDTSDSIINSSAASSMSIDPPLSAPANEPATFKKIESCTAFSDDTTLFLASIRMTMKRRPCCLLVIAIYIQYEEVWGGADEAFLTFKIAN